MCTDSRSDDRASAAIFIDRRDLRSSSLYPSLRCGVSISTSCMSDAFTRPQWVEMTGSMTGSDRPAICCRSGCYHTAAGPHEPTWRYSPVRPCAHSHAPVAHRATWSFGHHPTRPDSKDWPVEGRLLEALATGTATLVEGTGCIGFWGERIAL